MVGIHWKIFFFQNIHNIFKIYMKEIKYYMVMHRYNIYSNHSQNSVQKI